jgi:hypothetical protein
VRRLPQNDRFCQVWVKQNPEKHLSRHRRGSETAGQGQSGASRRATRKRTVDSSVAHRVPWQNKGLGVRSLGMTDWGAYSDFQGPAALRAACGMKTGVVIPRPGHAAIRRSRRGLQGRGIYCRLAGGRTRQPAPPPRRRNSRTGPVRGVATSHEERHRRKLGARNRGQPPCGGRPLLIIHSAAATKSSARRPEWIGQTVQSTSLRRTQLSGQADSREQPYVQSKLGSVG